MVFPELLEFRDDDDAVEIGSGLTLTAIGELWEDAPQIFREWLPLFASVLIRNRATLGGNLATASPIGDSAPMLLALDAEVRIAGVRDDRVVKLCDFFKGYRQTALAPDEIIRSVRIPKPLPPQARFYKVAKRSMDDISTVAACFAITRDRSDRIARARIKLSGAWRQFLIRARGAEGALEGSFGTEDDLARAKEAIRRELHPIGDHRGSAEYRLALAQSLVDKFWSEQISMVDA